MSLSKNESRSIRHQKVENGFVITVETSKQGKNGTEWKTKQYISKTAIETKKLLNELIQ